MLCIRRGEKIMDKPQNKRHFALDLARVIAILCVVIVHSSAEMVSIFEPGEPAFLFGNLINGGGRIAVPFYLMISGALFLDERKQFSIKEILLKYVKSMIVIALIWSAIYAVALPMIGGNSIGIKATIKSAIYGPYHIWYLYMMSLLYIATPLIKKFATKENSKLALLFIAVSLGVQFSVPFLKMLYKLGINLKIIADMIDQAYSGFFEVHIAYYLAGWYIVHVGINKKWQRIAVYAVGILTYIAMILYVQYTGDIKNPYFHRGLVVFLFSVSLFLALTNINWQPNKKVASVVAHLSKLSFGVYLVHVIVLEACKRFMNPMPHPILYTLGLCAAVTGGSYLFSFVVSKIPVLKKMIKA